MMRICLQTSNSSSVACPSKWIHSYWVNRSNIGMLIQHPSDRPKFVLHWLPQILATMSCNKDKFVMRAHGQAQDRWNIPKLRVANHSLIQLEE